MYRLISFFFLLVWGLGAALAQSSVKIAKLKYNGGGDWYANKTALPNLINFCNRNLQMDLVKEEDMVEVGSPDIFLYAMQHPYLCSFLD